MNDSPEIQDGRLSGSLGDSLRTNYSLIEKLADLSNQDAWVEFWEKYHPRIRRWTGSWLAKSTDADDAAQETLIKLVKYIQSYDRDKGVFRSWLRTCARRAAINVYQQQQRPEHADMDSLEQLADGFADELEPAMLFDVFRSACAKLRQRAALLETPRWEVFAATQFDGLSYREASERFGLSQGNIRVQVCRARKELADELRILGYTELADGLFDRPKTC